MLVMRYRQADDRTSIQGVCHLAGGDRDAMEGSRPSRRQGCRGMACRIKGRKMLWLPGPTRGWARQHYCGGGFVEGMVSWGSLGFLTSYESRNCQEGSHCWVAGVTSFSLLLSFFSFFFSLFLSFPFHFRSSLSLLVLSFLVFSFPFLIPDLVGRLWSFWPEPGFSLS